MKTRIWLAMIAVYIVWGSTYLAIRFAVESLPPFLMASSRFFVSGLILYAWRRLAGDPAPTRIEWRSAAIIGSLLLVGGNGLVSWAEQSVPSGIAALLVGAAPLWMVLIDALHPGGVRPAWQTVVGVLVGFTGITLLVGPGRLGQQSAGVHLSGVLALFAAGFLWASGSLYGRSARLPASALMATGMEMLAGSAGLALVGSLLGEWGRVDLAAVSARSLLGLGYLVVFGSLVGFAAYTWLLRVAPTPLVSTYAYVNPLIAVLLGSLLAGERVTLPILVAAVFILGAVAVINLPRSKAPALSTPSD